MLKPGAEPIPGYRLEQFLGRGQFGEVWRSTAPGGGKAALKFLDLGGKQGWKEFRGIQSVKKIRHPHLMPITALWLLDHHWKVIDDAAVDRLSTPSAIAETLRVEKTPIHDVPEPRWLVVAQLLGDKTLGDRLKECEGQGNPAIPVDELLRYMEEAAKGIDFLNSAKHDLGKGRVSVQHCDIKPANILLLGDSVLICDYGVAQVLSDGDLSTTATGMVGSPAYMAPECIERKPSSCSDQYSLAVTYVELRTGALPFTNESYFDVIEAHRRGKLDLSRLTPAERAVIRKATAVDPRQRYPQSQDMVRDLYRAVHGDESPRPRWKQIVPLALTLSVIAAGIATLANLYLRPDPTETLHAFEIQVDPPSVSQIEVDGQTIPLANGRGTIERKPVGQIEIEFPATEEYDTVHRSVTLSEFLNSPIPIQLQQRPGYLVQQAWDALDRGKSSESLDFFQRALAKSPELKRFERPSELLQADTQRTAEFLKISRDGKWLVAGVNRSGMGGQLMRWSLADVAMSTPANGPRENRLAGTIEPLVLETKGLVALELGQQWVVVVESEEAQSAQVVIRAIDDWSAERARFPVANNVVALALSADERYLVLASDLMNEEGQYGLQRMDLQDESQTEPILLGTHDDVISQVRIHEDGSVFTASWADNHLIHWLPAGSSSDAQEPWTKEVLAVMPDDLNDLLLTSDRLIAGGGDLTDTKNYPLVYFDEGNSEPHFFPEGHTDVIQVVVGDKTKKWIASGSEDGTIHVWRMAESGPGVLRPLVGGPVSVSALAFVDEQTLISATADGTIVLWDLRSNPRIVDQQKKMHLPVLGSHGNLVKQLAIDPSGRWLFSASHDGSVRCWDLARNRIVKQACEVAKLAPLPATP